jgi:RNA polymerase primary sigma factor
MEFDSESIGVVPKSELDIHNPSAIARVGGIATRTVSGSQNTDEIEQFNPDNLFTGNVSDPVSLYLNGIGKIPLLTKDDEVRLAKQLRLGQELAETDNPTAEQLRDKKQAEIAKEVFIRSNLRLVVSIARRYPLPSGMDLLDLIQEGNIGLEHAVDLFKHEKGFKFSTYATFWIRQTIGRALDQQGSLIRLPGDRAAALRAALRQIKSDEDKLDEENEQNYRLTTPASLDKTMQDGEGTLGDVIPAPEHFNPANTVMAKVESEILDELLSTLGPQAKFAVQERFGLNDGEFKSFSIVGDKMGISAEAARRLISRSISILQIEAPGFFNEQEDTQ